MQKIICAAFGRIGGATRFASKGASPLVCDRENKARSVVGRIQYVRANTEDPKRRVAGLGRKGRHGQPATGARDQVGRGGIYKGVDTNAASCEVGCYCCCCRRRAVSERRRAGHVQLEWGLVGRDTFTPRSNMRRRARLLRERNTIPPPSPPRGHHVYYNIS